MSFELMRQVWSIDLPATEQHVLMAMADFATDDGENCYPSHGRLAWKTGYSERTIARAINGFIESGVVIVLRLGTNKAPPRYHLCLDVAKQKAPYRSETGESRGDPVSPQNEAGGDPVSSPNSLGRSSVTPGGDPVSAWGDRGSPDPIINLSSNQSDKRDSPLPEKATEKEKAETAAETARNWATCLLEIGGQDKTIDAWLQGSELIATGRMEDSKPLYQVLVVDPRHVEWIKDRMGRNIRWRLSTLFGMPVAVDVIAELAAVMP